MTDIIPLDTVVDEVHLSYNQLRELHARYGNQGMETLARQILDKGLVIEENPDEMSIKVRRPRGDKQ